MRRRTTAAAGLAIVWTALGCVPARDAAPVITVQRQAIETLATRHAHDAAGLHAATGALLEIRRAALLARLETAALEATFAGEPLPIDGWGATAAAAWLREFEAVIDDGAARRDLIAQLPAVLEFEDGAAALLDALETRRLETATLYADALASTAVIESVVSGEIEGPSPAELLRELYAQELREHISKPAKRDAADRVVDRLLGPTSEGADR